MCAGIYLLGSNIASTDKDVDTRIAKAWAALNILNSIWKSTEKPEKKPPSK